METIIKLKSKDLNARLLSKIKRYAGNEKGLEIQISIKRSDRKSNSSIRETQSQARQRIDRAIEQIEKGKNLVKFSGEEFETLTNLLLKRAS
jgi:hypothetical protein